MRYNNLTFIFLMATFLHTSIFAQLTPQEAIEGMGRGINLGNTLEPPLEGGWNNGPAQESYFDAYLEAGFSNIRIPVRWDQHTGNSAPFQINTAWMDRVEEVVDWGLERGFYITLNGHHEDWLKNNYANPTLRARYDAIWVQISERFKDKSEKLIFEIINEPKGMTVSQVDDLNERILGIIRQNNPTRIVIYGGNEWANAEQLLQAKIPNDDFLIGYYHSYDPWQFSGQGQGTWGSNFDYQLLNNKYQSVKNWSTTNNIPVHHSEFGAIHACDYNSRMRIYAHNVEQCIKHGFAFSVWDDGGDFGILKRNNNTWPEVKDILMHYHLDSPRRIFSEITEDPDTELPAIEVKWENRTTETTDIILERATTSANAFEQIATLPAGTTSYLDNDVEAGKTYTYRMYTTKNDGTLIHGYPTRVRITATVQSPFKGEPLSVPGTIEVEEYDLGGEGLAYHDDDPANIPNAYRTDEGVDIGAHAGGYILEYVANGEWIEYTVDAAQAGVYSVRADVASELPNGSFSINFDKNDMTTGFSTPSTNNWYTFTQISANNTIELEAGIQTMRLSITSNNAFNVDRLIFNLETPTSTEETASESFNVFPNPSADEIYILGNIEYYTHIHMVTTAGKVVKTTTISSQNPRVDISDLPSGIYIVQIAKKDGSLVSQKLIKE